MTEVEQLLEDWFVLDRAVEELRDAMSRYRSSVTVGIIRMCGSHAWREQRQVIRELWGHRVHVYGYADGAVRYKLHGVECTREIDQREIASGVKRYMERVEQMLDKK